MTGKYGSLIEKARNTDNHKDGKPENHKDGPENTQPSSKPVLPDVNMTIKVPKAWRQHWVSKAKGEGATLTAIIIEALTEKYGLPENQ